MSRRRRPAARGGAAGLRSHWAPRAPAAGQVRRVPACPAADYPSRRAPRLAPAARCILGLAARPRPASGPLALRRGRRRRGGLARGTFRAAGPRSPSAPWRAHPARRPRSAPQPAAGPGPGPCSPECRRPPRPFLRRGACAAPGARGPGPRRGAPQLPAFAPRGLRPGALRPLPVLPAGPRRAAHTRGPSAPRAPGPARSRAPEAGAAAPPRALPALRPPRRRGLPAVLSPARPGAPIAGGRGRLRGRHQDARNPDLLCRRSRKPRTLPARLPRGTGRQEGPTGPAF